MHAVTAPCPLTPALSQRERESVRGVWAESEAKYGRVHRP